MVNLRSILAADKGSLAGWLANGLGDRGGEDVFRLSGFEDKDTRGFSLEEHAAQVRELSFRASTQKGQRLTYAALRDEVDRAFGIAQVNGQDTTLREIRRKLIDSAFMNIPGKSKPDVVRFTGRRSRVGTISGAMVGRVRSELNGEKRRERQMSEVDDASGDGDMPEIPEAEWKVVGIVPDGPDVGNNNADSGNGDDGDNGGDGGDGGDGNVDGPTFPDSIDDDCSGSNSGCVVGFVNWARNRRNLALIGLAAVVVAGGVCISRNGGSGDDERAGATRQAGETPTYTFGDYQLTEVAKGATKTATSTVVPSATPAAIETASAIATITKTKGPGVSTPVPASTVAAIIATSTAKAGATIEAAGTLHASETDQAPIASFTASAVTRTPDSSRVPSTPGTVTPEPSVSGAIATQTETPTSTPTETPISTAINTATRTATATSTATQTATGTPNVSETQTPTEAPTKTNTSTRTATSTATVTATATPDSSGTQVVPPASPTPGTSPSVSHPATSGELSQEVAKFLIAVRGNAKIDHKGDNFTRAIERDLAPLGITEPQDIASYVQFEQNELGKDLNLVYEGDEIVRTDDLINKEAYIWRVSDRPLSAPLVAGLEKENVPVDNTAKLSLDGKSVTAISASPEAGDTLVQNSQKESPKTISGLAKAMWETRQSGLVSSGGMAGPAPRSENTNFSFRKLYSFLFDDEDKGKNSPLAYQR